MTDNISFLAKDRSKAGTGTSREFRRSGYIPAIIYGDNRANEAIAVPFRDFCNQYEKGLIQTKVIELDFGTHKVSAVVKAIQKDKVMDTPIHIDFQRIGKDTLIRFSVNVNVIGQDKCPGIKKGGVLNIMKRKIPFYCDPRAIPHSLTIDISEVEVGQVLHINDITLPKNATPIDKKNFAVISLTGRDEESEKSAQEGV